MSNLLTLPIMLPEREHLAFDPVINAMVDLRTGQRYALRLFKK